ncbi:MAG TPA: hypothetical protein VKD65_00380, partial [Candidatus Angelobacter sp.]|nr:hypothetical protein [Candidatus Angelobacter sp.]
MLFGSRARLACALVLVVLTIASAQSDLQSQGKNSTPAESSIKAPDVTGDWLGTLEVGATRLRIIFHISKSSDGLKATIDSPDQNASGLPVSSVQLSGSSLTLESPRLNAVYEGKVSADLSTLDGTWKQGVMELPLKLKRVKDKAELAPPRRPQTP